MHERGCNTACRMLPGGRPAAQPQGVQVVCKYSPLYKLDPRAAASLQPEQASSVARPAKRISLKYNLRVEEAPQSKSPGSMLGEVQESSADSIPAFRSTSQIALEA